MFTFFLGLQWPVNQGTQIEPAAKRRVQLNYPLKAHKSAWIENQQMPRLWRLLEKARRGARDWLSEGTPVLINVVPELMLAFAAARTSQVCRYEVALARRVDFWRALSRPC